MSSSNTNDWPKLNLNKAYIMLYLLFWAIAAPLNGVIDAQFSLHGLYDPFFRPPLLLSIFPPSAQACL